ncbi:hypothetical protein D3C83_70450 [compost metagenome]
MDALLALDHLLGARQRLGAHFLGRLVQPGDVLAHRSPSQKQKGPASCLDGARAPPDLSPA